MKSNQFNGDNTQSNQWSHLTKYEKILTKDVILMYNQIMAFSNDIQRIASDYQLTEEDVSRAKDYAFGSGVSKYQFLPDIDMANAWQRLSLGKGTNIDEVLLRHEILESYLVINQGMIQKEAHNFTQLRYPWSELL